MTAMLATLLAASTAAAALSPLRPLPQLISHQVAHHNLHATPSRARPPSMIFNPIKRALKKRQEPAKFKPTKKDTFNYAAGKRNYGELSREYRRTVFMHDEWKRHRGSDRFVNNMKTIFNSGITSQLGQELTVVAGAAMTVIVANCLLGTYTDLSGGVNAGPLAALGKDLGPIALPNFFFSIMMPALSLLLVFRVNSGYSRWNEARTLWGGVINTCRNIVRQANIYFPDTPEGNALKARLLSNTAAFSRALRNFLRGPSDDATLKGELYELVVSGQITRQQADACMAASNRAMFCLNGISAVVAEAKLAPIDKARLDQSISTLVDLTGACERIFKSPVPLVYTRHTARFITAFSLLLPLGLWPVMDTSWNHWVTLPASMLVSLFLFGIEEIGIQIEEPFSILPIEAFCDGAITATMKEMLDATNARAFTPPVTPVPKGR